MEDHHTHSPHHVVFWSRIFVKHKIRVIWKVEQGRDNKLVLEIMAHVQYLNSEQTLEKCTTCTRSVPGSTDLQSPKPCSVLCTL